MRRLILLIALVVLVVVLAGSPASAVPDSDTSPTRSDISDNQIATNQSAAGNSSASATITITMTGIADE